MDDTIPVTCYLLDLKYQIRIVAVFAEVYVMWSVGGGDVERE